MVQAWLLMDARALLESVLKKNVGSPLRYFGCGFFTLKLQDYCFNSICVWFVSTAYAKLRKFEITRKNVLLFKPYKFQYFDSCCSKIWSSPSNLEDLWAYDSKKNISKWGNNPNHGKRCSPSVIVNTSLILKNLEEGRIEDCMALLKRMLQEYGSWYNYLFTNCSR